MECKSLVPLPKHNKIAFLQEFLDYDKYWRLAVTILSKENPEPLQWHDPFTREEGGSRFEGIAD